MAWRSGGGRVLGGPEVLSLVDSDVPAPGPGEVSVRAWRPGSIPSTTSSTAVRQCRPRGSADAGGRSCPGGDRRGGRRRGPAGPLSVGDEVMVFPAPGAYASELTVPAVGVAPKPSELSWDEAAGLRLAGGTAVHALTVVGAAEGETVLMHGASGGVGLLAVQIAVAAGATVLGTASEDRLEPSSGTERRRCGRAGAGGTRARGRARRRGRRGRHRGHQGGDGRVPGTGAGPSRIVSILAFDRGDTGIKLIGGAPTPTPAPRSGPARGGSWPISHGKASWRSASPVRTRCRRRPRRDRFLAEGHPGGKVVLLA